MTKEERKEKQKHMEEQKQMEEQLEEQMAEQATRNEPRAEPKARTQSSSARTTGASTYQSKADAAEALRKRLAEVDKDFDDDMEYTSNENQEADPAMMNELKIAKQIADDMVTDEFQTGFMDNEGLDEMDEDEVDMLF